MKLELIGAADTVTGSKSILTIGEHRLMIDSGLYQGIKDASELNHEEVASRNIDSIFITHAHLDHSGYLPIMIKNGFNGRIYCTHETKELINIVLNDSVKVQLASLKKNSHEEVLYTKEDVESVIQKLHVVEQGVDYKIHGLTIRFIQAGHILGASSIIISNRECKVCFSGDIGRGDDPLHHPPEVPLNLDYLVLESTYGDRLHSKESILEHLRAEIEQVIESHGVLLIPCFAIARTQMMMLYLYEVFKQYPNLKIPVFFDSPMAMEATIIYEKNINQTRLKSDEFEALTKSFTLSRYESCFDKVRKKKTPFVVVSSSGMLGGGMILKYLDMFIKHKENTILFCGYQAEGTLGRKILDGEEGMELNGHRLNMRANIRKLDGLSAHADKNELIDYALGSKNTLRKVFLNHGEKESMIFLKSSLEEKLSVPIIISNKNEVHELD